MSANVGYALLSLAFIFLSTTLGAAAVCVFPDSVVIRCFPHLSGFSAGVMIAASVWSLLIPAMENSAFTGAASVTEAVTGFIIGGAFMILITVFLPEEHGSEINSFSRLFVAVTVHNVPEGLAVGFSFGAIGKSSLSVAAAIAVAFGIGIQNLPEGAAVALPARHVFGRGKAFIYGSMSGVVEPVAGIIGFFAAGFLSPLLPYLMSFAAGAMVFASVADVLPEALEESRLKTTVGVIAGFLLMMTLDVLFG